MAQASFAELEHDLKKRRTRRELFLEKMDKLVPWERLERRVEPFYAKAGRGRRPYPLSVMLRVRCVQLFYNLSDPGMEDLLYEVESVRRFVGLRLTEALPDETTILNFRHLLEKHGLGEGLVRQANWQKVGGASPPERRSNRTTFLREPCVGSREGAGEASVAAWMGRLLSTVKAMIRGAEAFRSVEGNIAGIVLVRCRRAPRCQRTHARSHAFCWDPGRSSNCPDCRKGAA